MEASQVQKNEIDSQRAIREGQNQKRIDFIAGLPGMVRGVFGRAYTGKSPTKAIKAKCIDCTGCEDYRNRVRDCATVTCPLHPYRPYQVDECDE